MDCGVKGEEEQMNYRLTKRIQARFCISWSRFACHEHFAPLIRALDWFFTSLRCGWSLLWLYWNIRQASERTERPFAFTSLIDWDSPSSSASRELKENEQHVSDGTRRSCAIEVEFSRTSPRDLSPVVAVVFSRRKFKRATSSFRNCDFYNLLFLTIPLKIFFSLSTFFCSVAYTMD